MVRLLLAILLAAAGIRTATGDMVDVISTATWSFVNTYASSSLDAGASQGAQTSLLTFDLAGIPAGAKIDGAALTINDVSTSWDFGFNTPNLFGCMPSPGPLTFFGEAIFCSDVDGAEFTDTVTVDGNPPGAFTQLSSIAPGTPIQIDPSVMTAGGAYAISIDASAVSIFGAFDDFGHGVPPLPSFSVNGKTEAELQVQVSETPEPASYAFAIGGFLVAMTAVAIRRRAAQRD